jgi:Domain of unknown function (DUF5680)
MDEQLLQELNRFIGRASRATYASGGGEVAPWRKGFKELEHREGDWYYRDSYTGSLRSWGQEVIWYKDEPVWSCLYGGGMSSENMNAASATETFDFLKKALLAGEKEGIFQPRGPVDFQDGEWAYHCNLNGDSTLFRGDEHISRNGIVVFTHNFFGGVVEI